MSSDMQSDTRVATVGMTASRSAQDLAKPLGHGPPPSSSLPANPLKPTRFGTYNQARKIVSGPIGTVTSSTPMSGIYLGELNWWTTDQHIVDLGASLGSPIQLNNVSFSEHKVNGKSKGVAYVEFEKAEHAATVKDWLDANEFQHHKMNAQLSAGSGGQNPFKTLPKEPYQRSTSTPNPSFRPDASTTRPHRLASSTLSQSGADATLPSPRTASGTWRSQAPVQINAQSMGQSLSAPAAGGEGGSAELSGQGMGKLAGSGGFQGGVGAQQPGFGVQGGAFGGFWHGQGGEVGQNGGGKRERVEGVC